MTSIIDYIMTLFDHHKLARRILLFWLMGLITYTVVTFFGKVNYISGPVSGVIIAILGLLSVGTAMYQRSRGNDDIKDK